MTPVLLIYCAATGVATVLALFWLSLRRDLGRSLRPRLDNILTFLRHVGYPLDSGSPKM